MDTLFTFIIVSNFRGRTEKTLKTFYNEQLLQIMQCNTANSIFHIMSLQLRPVSNNGYLADQI